MERRPSCWPAADYGRRPCGFVSLRWATVVVCSIILLCLAQGKEAFGAVERMLPSFLVFDDDALGYKGRKWGLGNGNCQLATGLSIYHALLCLAIAMHSDSLARTSMHGRRGMNGRPTVTPRPGCNESEERCLDHFAFCIFGRKSSIFEVLNVD